MYPYFNVETTPNNVSSTSLQRRDVAATLIRQIFWCHLSAGTIQSYLNESNRYFILNSSKGKASV